MTEEDMNRKMEFILNTLARITINQEQDEEAQKRREEAQKKHEEAQIRNEEAQKRNGEEIEKLRNLMEFGWQETRYAIDKLMTAIENDREFMQQIARLAVTTERRVTWLESQR